MSKHKKRILIITGTRADYGLFRPVIKEIKISNKLEPELLVTGMHTQKKFGFTINDIKKDGFPIKCIINTPYNSDMMDALSNDVIGIKKYCMKNRPDMILVLGDRGEQFAGAIVGSHLRIPIGHIHGGDVTGHVVDEYIRHSITKFAHLHFAATPKSYKRIILLGEEKNRVFLVGAPGLDEARVLKYVPKKTLATKLGLKVNKKWFLMIQHPTPLDNISFVNQIEPLLKAIEKEDGEKIIIYPNSDTGKDIIISEINKYRGNKEFHIFKNLDREIYLNVMKHADIMIGNSSSGIMESSFFKLPVVNVGNRQLGREHAENVVNCDYTFKNIKKAISIALSRDFKQIISKSKNPYGDGTASKKIVKILEKNINKNNLFYKKFTHAKI
ncbi:MAG: UDP-N-acetylglucosamine 2-epimerase (hydrolyzing) [Candidatus Yanofskybacteria bacterium CG10_big_fil_rev_8_21_14_0_10_36_16]|uniref:UDP-N-acetylglucosamine 2-epimerase (Hydrolyzing) n=1 Tax=Candidatus Yanofskybacteria bacterium CG10_big_fil_rev_8_21_14_0_10_36_16 TaxID=1975096 RepID=A0A2J0Q7J3_9BACT|nr:MAG: UDP-N-acetylglucosamine 2-epimerase (hydrolyzing) [Candidatus Yanofskybacteria bacterium CG10_big_fil_rev_8_21_14_0_10_36_16]